VFKIERVNVVMKTLRRLFGGAYWPGVGLLHELLKLEGAAGSAGLRRMTVRVPVFCSIFLAMSGSARAQTAGNGLDSFTNPLKEGLNLIMIFGFIAGCVMVIAGFLNARRDENWKMNVIYGIGVAGAVALMKALFAMFGGSAASTIAGF
jgi:hypothetical protein